MQMSHFESMLLDNIGASCRSEMTSPKHPVQLLPIFEDGAGKVAKGDRYKTELCRPFSENGVCRYGEKCQFAHGVCELRTVLRHPKYKTNLCRTFHSTGFCPYGSRCHFIHGETGSTTGSNLSPGSPPNLNHAPLIGKHKGESTKALVHDLDIQQLILGIRLLLDRRSSDSGLSTTAPGFEKDPLPVQMQQPLLFSNCNVSPHMDTTSWSTFCHTPDLMGSTAVSPTLSCSDSPVPSPTSMILSSTDFWLHHLSNIVGV